MSGDSIEDKEVVLLLSRFVRYCTLLPQTQFLVLAMLDWWSSSSDGEFGRVPSPSQSRRMLLLALESRRHQLLSVSPSQGCNGSRLVQRGALPLIACCLDMQ